MIDPRLLSSPLPRFLNIFLKHLLSNVVDNLIEFWARSRKASPARLFKARGTLASWQPWALGVEREKIRGRIFGDLQIEIFQGLLESVEGPLCQGDVVVRKLQCVQPGVVRLSLLLFGC